MIAESSKAFIFQEFAVKFYFGLSLHIFQHGSSLSLENLSDSWWVHQTGFSSAAFVSQSKSTELSSSAAVVRRQSKFTELTLTLTLLFHRSYSTNSVKPKPGAYTACGQNDRKYPFI